MAHWPLWATTSDLISGLLLPCSGSAVGEAIALAVHLEDADVMGQPVEQCAGEALGAEGLGPFIEGQIAGNQGRAALVTLRDQLEQQFGAGLGQRHKAQFVDDQQLVTGHLLLKAKQTALVAGLHHLTDQARGGGEAKGCLSRKTGLAMAFRLMMSAQKKWRKLDGQNRLPEIIQGIEFRDGLRQLQTAA